MKNCRKSLIVLSVCLFFTIGLSGCGHYDRDEAAAWFKENIADETIAVSKDYTKRENENGYIDHVWEAHLKDLPEVEFELISHAGYSLFPTYNMETTYNLEMGKYYLNRYLNENPDSLDNLNISAANYNSMVYVSAVYDNGNEIPGLCSQMEQLDHYLLNQEYPCAMQYGLAYREPLTLPGEKSAAASPYFDTYVSEKGGTEKKNRTEQKESDNSETPTETLCRRAQESYVHYAAVYRLDLDQFTEEQLQNAANKDIYYQFIITRSDGTQLCYPELLLRYSDKLSFGTLYEVLLREGNYQVSGTQENFEFTSVDGSICSFSYSYYRSSENGRDNSETAGSGSFYYLKDDTEIFLSDQPLTDSELFAELTGLTFTPFSR